MWQILSSLISGIISPITNTITAIYTKKEDVSLEKFKVDGQVDLGLIQATTALSQAQASLLGNRWIVFLQVGFGLPLMIYYGKCIVWDKVLAWGSTDPLKGDIGTYSTWIVGFLFLHSALTSWTRKT
jgi:hypothetical protein